MFRSMFLFRTQSKGENVPVRSHSVLRNIFYCVAWRGCKRHSSGRITIRLCRLGDRGIVVWFLLVAKGLTPRLAAGPTEPSTEWVPGPRSFGINLPGRDADHLPTSRAEVKNEWRSTSALPICLYSVHTEVFIFSIYSDVAISSLMPLETATTLQ